MNGRRFIRARLTRRSTSSAPYARGKDWIAAQRPRELKTGINSLVGYNRVFGYYIEVTKSNPVPADYIRKQTLAEPGVSAPALRTGGEDTLGGKSIALERLFRDAL